MLFRKKQDPPASSRKPEDITRLETAAHLRLADKFIREGKFSEAREELDSVKSIDRNNVYALALEERLHEVEAAAAKSRQQTEAEPVQDEPKERETARSEPLPSQPDEQAIRREIEGKLKSEYDKRFTDEIRKAEQRIAEALRKEREWQESERASLISGLEKEKEKFRQELERQARENLEVEIGRMEATYRQQLAAEKRRAEEETRSEMSALYEKSMLELKEDAAREKRALLDKERKAVEDSRKQMKADFERQLAAELSSIKAASREEQEREREKTAEMTRQRLQREFEEKLEIEKKRIEEQIRSQQIDLEKIYEGRYAKLESSLEAELKMRLEEIERNEQAEFEHKIAEARGQLETEYQQKLANEIASQREKMSGQVEDEIEIRRSRLEANRREIVEEEQRKLNEARESMRMEMEQEVVRRIADARVSAEASYDYKLKLLGLHLPDTREEKLQMYKTRLREAWVMPPLTPEVAGELTRLRDVLGLTFEDHTECEGEVRVQAFLAEVEKEIRKGRIRAGETRILNDLKEQYQMTAEESGRLEPQILSASERAAMKAVILVVDDEQSLLDSVKMILEGYGFNVLTCQSTTDAVKLLETTSVDLIISDVVFSGTEGDGFSFFEHVQKIPHLKKVPFILLSGMHENFFVRTGIQLGVDDYLTKPVDPDMLAAVVEGKLKKYRSLNESS